jgi:hypothetical protein
MEVFDFAGQFYKVPGFKDRNKKFEKRVLKRMKNVENV